MTPTPRRLLTLALAGSVLLLPVGCGSLAPLFGKNVFGGAKAAGAADEREIPLTPGVPSMGQAPRIARDPALDGTTSFNLVYTNDIHSRVDPFPTNFYYTLYAGKGGFSRLTTAIAAEKQANPATLAVDSGDYLQGTPYFNFYKGETELRLMDAAGFDAVTIGNHEFDNGVAALRKVLPYYKGSLVTTNLTFAPDLGVRYTVKKVGAVRVGMFALITEVNGLVSPQYFEGAKYYDPILVARAAVEKLKKESDVVVLLSHMGTKAPWEDSGASANTPEAELAEDHAPDAYEGDEPDLVTDEVLAAKVPGIDVIVSGHTHVMINTPKVVRSGNHKTYLISTGMGGGFLGKASISLTKGQVTGLRNQMIPMTSSVPAAPAIESVIKPYRDRMDGVVKQPAGVATGPFRRYGNKDMESTLNNLITDATLAAARTVRPDVDFAVVSSGTPRNNLAAGKLLVEDCYYALPFDNQIAVMEVNGQQALDMLTIQRRPTDNKRHAISNASYVLTRNNGPIENVMIGGKPLDLNGHYVVAVTDYMADGSSGFTMLPGCKRTNTGIVQRDALIRYIQAKGTVSPELGRIVLKGSR